MLRRSHTTTTAARSAASITMINRSVFIQAYMGTPAAENRALAHEWKMAARYPSEDAGPE